MGPMSLLAIVTGLDNSVIARAIAVDLLNTGYQVVIPTDGTYAEGSEAKRLLEEEITDPSALQIEAVDLADGNSVDSFVERMKKSEIQLIVNSAAILASNEDGSLRNESTSFHYDEFSKVLQFNVTSVAAICLGLSDSLNDGACIINITSTAAQEGAFETISYNASKAAVDSLTMTLANRFGPARGVRVNSIAPGWIPPSPDVAAGGIVALANSLTPSLSTGSPEHVVKAVRYVISNEFQNGAVIDLDGGLTSSYLPYMLESLDLRGIDTSKTMAEIVDLIEKAKHEFKISK